MDAREALADLTEISWHVESAVLCDSSGAVAASTQADDAGATALTRVAVDLFAAAGTVRPAGPAVTRVEASFPEGALFAVREGDRLIVATTTPEPPAALVVYDLRAALRASAPGQDGATRKKASAARRAKRPEDADVAS